MSKSNGELTECIKELGLPTVKACYAELADSARREGLSYEAYLLEVMQRECQRRRQSRMERLLRESRLPVDKSLGAFDLKRLPGKVSAVVRTLMEGSFVAFTFCRSAPSTRSLTAAKRRFPSMTTYFPFDIGSTKSGS